MTVKELVDLLMGFPEDEPVYVPDFQQGSWADKPVTNVVLTYKGVILDF